MLGLSSRALRHLCGGVLPFHLLLAVWTFACSVGVGLGMDPSPTPELVPVMYRVYCTPSLSCDGRSSYCTGVTGYENCQPCTDICGEDGSYTECQNKCGVYLKYTQEQQMAKKQQEWMQDLIGAREEREKRQFTALRGEVDSLQSTNMALVAVTVFSVFLLVGIVAVLAKVICDLKRPPYGPIAQETQEIIIMENESGLGTAPNNTPQPQRREETAAGEGGEKRPAAIISNPTQDP